MPWKTVEMAAVHTMFKVLKTSQPLLRHYLAAPRCRTPVVRAMASLSLSTYDVKNPRELNFILGHAHFIQTADDLAEICARHGVPKFGAAFCEASEGHDPEVPGRRVRTEGNDAELEALAADNALAIGAGHSFILFMDGAFPISILNAVKAAPTVCRVIAATANSTTVLLAAQGEGRVGIVGVIDGQTSVAIEDDKDKRARKDFLRMIGYKR